jgi:hypothetical protein
MKKTILLIFLINLILVSITYAVEKVGIVEEIKGVGEALRMEGFVKLNVNDPIFEGDTLRTRSNSLMRIKFFDGKIIVMTEKTKLQVDKYSKNKEITTSRGGVRSIIDKALEKDETFKIKTTTAVAGVRGTDFVVLFLGDEMSIYVFSGLVNVKNDLGEIELEKGYHTIVRLNQPPLPPILTSIEQMNQIMQLFNVNSQINIDKIHFLDSPVIDIEKKDDKPPLPSIPPNIPPSETNPKIIEPFQPPMTYPGL